GFYTGTQTITITNNEPNSVLRYTTNGDNPTAASPIYSSPITVSITTVVKAQAFSNDASILPGKMDFNTYFINEDFTLAVFSVAADEVINLANGDGVLIPIGSLEYFNTDKEREATSYGSLNRHGQDSWVLDHRSIDWISRDEMGYSKAVNAELFSYSDRDEYQKFMFRNSGDDNYPAINDGDHEGSTHIRDEFIHQLAQDGGMKLDVRAVERVILFLNGEYWGVYGMRERPVDHDYTKEYYDQGKYDIQYLSTWGNTEIEYGGQQAQDDWANLRNFILNNDMSVDANYQIAEDSINLTSMIDYFLVNLNVVASDWLNYNTGWWRGRDLDGDHKKWGYILWDLDASFDYYINYSGVPDISPNAEPCDLEEIGDFMDDFFGSGGTYNPVANPDQCQTILNGLSPYPYTDTIYQAVIAYDSYCCGTDWDNICQDAYDGFVT
ncbi:MAG: CotH kinase family protein, partial [Saprospiraceae bacterium]